MNSASLNCRAKTLVPACRLFPFLMVCCLCAPAIGQYSEDGQLQHWLTDLKSPVFTVRQSATKNLAALGAKVIPSIQAFCESSQDREAVTRAVQILGQILESRDESTAKQAESSLLLLSSSADKLLAHRAKATLARWRMEVCVRTVNRLKKLGASVGQPTTTADGTPEVYLQIFSKDWKGEDSDLQLLPDLGRIGLFKVDNAPIGNEGLRFLEKCRSVEKVYLDHTRIDSRGLSIIAKSPELKKLTVIGLSTLDRQGLEALTGISTLEILSLDASNVTNDLLPTLAKIKSLQTLDLSRTKITDEGLSALVELPRLHTLNLTGVSIDGDGIASLAKVNSLDLLNLRGAKLGPGALDAVGKLNQVRYVILDEIDLHAADFSKLANMNGLRRLDLCKCQITDNNAWTLGTLKNVTYLLLRDNQVSSNVRDRVAQEIPRSQILP